MGLYLGVAYIPAGFFLAIVVNTVEDHLSKLVHLFLIVFLAVDFLYLFDFLELKFGRGFLLGWFPGMGQCDLIIFFLLFPQSFPLISRKFFLQWLIFSFCYFLFQFLELNLWLPLLANLLQNWLLLLFFDLLLRPRLGYNQYLFEITKLLTHPSIAVFITY